MGKVIDLGLAGPDDPIYKGGLRVSSVLGPSALIANSPRGTDGTDPMLAGINALEASLQKQLADRTGGMVPSPKSASTTRKPRGNT